MCGVLERLPPLRVLSLLGHQTGAVCQSVKGNKTGAVGGGGGHDG